MSGNHLKAYQHYYNFSKAHADVVKFADDSGDERLVRAVRLIIDDNIRMYRKLSENGAHVTTEPASYKAAGMAMTAFSRMLKLIIRFYETGDMEHLDMVIRNLPRNYIPKMNKVCEMSRMKPSKEISRFNDDDQLSYTLISNRKQRDGQQDEAA